jgi:hypothetical protein
VQPEPEPDSIERAVGRRALRKQERERRRAREAGGAEVGEELYLEAGIAARSGNDGRAEPFAAVVQAEPAGEEAVAVGDVKDVARRSAGAGDRPGVDVGEEADVGGGVRDDGRLPAGARGGVDPDRVAKRGGERSERVLVPKLRLRRQRKRLERIVGRDAVELLPPVGRVDAPQPVDQIPQPRALEADALLRLLRLELRLERGFAPRRAAGPRG